MATFEKNVIQQYGSLEAFARADGCLRIYESEDNYHVVRKPEDEKAILTSPYIRNPRLVWDINKGLISEWTPAPTRESQSAPAVPSEVGAVSQSPAPERERGQESAKKWWQFWK